MCHAACGQQREGNVSDLATVTVTRAGAATVVRVVGEIDCSNAVQLVAPLGEALAPTDDVLVLDLVGCDYLDSAGIREILVLRRDLEERRQSLTLALDPAGPVHRVLALVGALDHVSWHRDVDEALRARADRT
jgi:anti-anti-sigma factor